MLYLNYIYITIQIVLLSRLNVISELNQKSSNKAGENQGKNSIKFKRTGKKNTDNLPYLIDGFLNSKTQILIKYGVSPLFRWIPTKQCHFPNLCPLFPACNMYIYHGEDKGTVYAGNYPKWPFLALVDNNCEARESRVHLIPDFLLKRKEGSLKLLSFFTLYS